MWPFKKPRLIPQTPEKIAKRAGILATPDLNMWLDQALNTTGRSVSNYNRSMAPDMLDEAIMGAIATLAILEEIKRRNVD